MDAYWPRLGGRMNALFEGRMARGEWIGRGEWTVKSRFSGLFERRMLILPSEGRMARGEWIGGENEFLFSPRRGEWTVFLNSFSHQPHFSRFFATLTSILPSPAVMFLFILPSTNSRVRALIRRLPSFQPLVIFHRGFLLL